MIHLFHLHIIYYEYYNIYIQITLKISLKIFNCSLENDIDTVPVGLPHPS